MSYLKTPFFLGDLKLSSNVFYAPLAGCSDLPFRRMSTKYKPGLIFCEMVKMDALVRSDAPTFHLLDYEHDMHPIGGQIVGSKPEIAGQAARMLEDMGFDVIDLNCGCPVDKVTKDGGGSGMLKTPQLIGDVLANMVAAVKIPVTLKIRTGWDEENINAEEITRVAEEASAKMITIHGRTRAQAYKGNANWDHIKSCKKVAKEIKVIGNGDIFDAEAAEGIFEHTNCDGILVSRGTLGQPWIAEDIYRRLNGLEEIIRPESLYREALLEHFEYSLQYYSEGKAVIDMRRLGCWYFKKDKRSKEFRRAITKVDTKEEVYRIIDAFFL
jgi:tRNA-dihydrouridine synthase B